MSRITCPDLSSKVVTADDAAAHISHGDRVAMSGFTGSGYPKAGPGAVAARARGEHDDDRDFSIELWTGASTAPELDGVLVEAGAVSKRLPF